MNVLTMTLDTIMGLNPYAIPWHAAKLFLPSAGSLETINNNDKKEIRRRIN